MKRFVYTLMFLLAGVSLSAQNSTVEKLSALLEGNTVRISYSYENAAGVPLGSGVATVQGGKYHVTEGNMQFFCDGVSLWTIDFGSKEVYIEKASAQNEIFGNIKGLLPRVKNLKYDGKKSVSLSFAPTEDSPDISCKAFIEDIQPAGESGQFSFDTGRLDSSWVITDIR